MSRAAVSKSRADKGKTQSAAPPAVTHEIVPGKFNDQDWSGMLEKDEGDDFIFDIVEEICDNAMKVIYDNYIQRQLLPFTISQARDAILQIIQWQFLSRDEGEINAETDSGWQEDEEPLPPVTDCWAQGSVPKHKMALRTPTPAIIEEEQTEEVKEEPEQPQVEPSPEEQPTPEMEETNIVEENNNIPEPETPKTAIEPTSKESTPGVGKRRVKWKPKTGRVGSAGVSKMTESLEQTEMKILEEQWRESHQELIDKEAESMVHMPLSCHSILKVQTGRPPGQKDVTYDEMGNVVAVMKLNPEKLPTHRVKVNYHIINPKVEAAQARLEAMRTGRYIVAKNKQKAETKKKATTGAPATMATVASTGAGLNTVATGRSVLSKKEAVGPLPPPLIESMEVQPGVVVKEGHRVKRGPRQQPRQADVMSTQSLRPISLHKPSPPVAVAEILERQSPVFRPLMNSPPIPPISPAQTNHQRPEIIT